MHFSQTQLVAKYGVLIRECGGLYYAFLEVSMNKIALWKNVRLNDWTAELEIIASNGKKWLENVNAGCVME